MNALIQRLVVCLVFWIAIAAGQTPAKGRMVVVISIDGFPDSALDDPYLPLPALRRLAQEGARGSNDPVNLETIRSWRESRPL